MIELIASICGLPPASFKKFVAEDSQYIFENDPSFNAINLYDFFGRSATVNSYKECYYYVELGFEPSKMTIYAYLQFVIIFVGLSAILYFMFSKKESIMKILKSTFRSITSFSIKKSTMTSLFVLFTLLQNFFIYDYVKTKSIRIPKFVDEYIALTSNINFYNNLDFNAGDFIGGSYSIFLTSGPISAIGGVFGWNVSSSFFVSRIANYYWLVALQILFSLILIRAYKVNKDFLIAFSFMVILLIPWWQGGLYSLGEIASMIIFSNGIFIFFKYRKLSLFLFSISIFFGKLLTALPFAGFYLLVFISEKSFKKIYIDVIFFTIPFFGWMLLILFNYEDGTVFDYIQSQLDLILNHQSAGFSDDTTVSLLSSIESSEVGNWNFYDILRLAFAPLIFLIIVYRNRVRIDQKFSKISLPLIGSLVAPYLWFWLLSPTKWMRYSQHFSILMILSLIYFINSDLFNKNIDYFLSASLLVLFIENNKNFILPTILLIAFLLYLSKNNYRHTIIKLFIVFIIFIDIVIPYYEKDRISLVNSNLKECEISLIKDTCRDAYFQQ